MHISKQEVPVRVRAPGAVARHAGDFGSLPARADMAGEYLSFAAGTDITPLLTGLDGDLCQVPHWGYLIEGRVVVTYDDGSSEALTGGDLFHLPAGHTVRVEQDAEMVLFSPQHDHAAVLDHIQGKIDG